MSKQFLIYKEGKLGTDYFEGFINWGTKACILSSSQRDAMKFADEKEARGFIKKNNLSLKGFKIREYTVV